MILFLFFPSQFTSIHYYKTSLYIPFVPVTVQRTADALADAWHSTGEGPGHQSLYTAFPLKFYDQVILGLPATLSTNNYAKVQQL